MKSSISLSDSSLSESILLPGSLSFFLPPAATEEDGFCDVADREGAWESGGLRCVSGFFFFSCAVEEASRFGFKGWRFVAGWERLVEPINSAVFAFLFRRRRDAGTGASAALARGNVGGC